MARLLIIEDGVPLAALLVSAAEAQGHVGTAVHSGRAGLAAAVSGRFDLALVDLLLPDMRGSEVLDGLRELGIPCIAMSGVFTGDRFAREAVERHGALAFFEKPFDLDRLLDAVDSHLVGHDDVDIELDDEVPLAELELELSDVVDEPAASTDEESFAELFDDEPLAAAASARPAPAVTPTVAPAATAPAAPAATAPDAPAPFSERGQVWSALEPDAPRSTRPATGPTAHRSLEGGALFGLLNACHQSSFTGEVRLSCDGIERILGFASGRLVGARSNLPDESFTRYCVRQGALGAELLAGVEELVQHEGLRADEAMVSMGVLTDDERTRLLEASIREIAWGAFPWRSGSSTLVPHGAPGSAAGPVSVPVANLVFGGLLATATLEALREELPPRTRLMPTADPPYELGELPLDGPQAQVLAHSDGSKCVEDLAALSDLPERELLATLMSLLRLGILEPRIETASRRITFGL